MKNKIPKIILLTLLLSFGLNTMAQVSINADSSTADPSAMLDVKSTEKGFLPPRMTEAERDAISSPVAGLVLWCSDCGDYGDLLVFNGTVWVSMNAAAGPFTCGDWLIDYRDDQAYRTTLIGNQCWMAENLNYDQSDFGNDWCYEDNSSYCNVFGRLYDWASVMQGFASSNSNPSGVQGVCPNGWHVPSRVEWDELESYVGNDYLDNEGTALKSITAWLWEWAPDYGTDNFGFTALPGGSHSYNTNFKLDIFGGWWSSTDNQTYSDFAWFRFLFSNDNNVNEYDSYKQYGFSVRCLRD